MDANTKRIGLRIRNRRQELEMTQDDLALKTGYKTRGAIAKIESGYCSMKQSVILNFAKALDVSPSWLLGENDNDTKIVNDKVQIPLEVIAPYFDDTETGKMAKMIAYNKDLRLLFDAAKDATPEQLKQAHDILLVLKNREKRDVD